MSLIGMPGYRETKAGWIPLAWAASPLGSVSSVRKGKGLAKPGIPCVELEHIEPETGRLVGWDNSGAQASIKTAFREGDVLFGKLRPYLRKYAVAPFDGICTTEILAIHPKEDGFDQCFLFYLMQGDGVFSTVEALSYGTKMPRVSWADLSEIVVGVPPLPEQQKIAAILTAVDDKLDIIARQIEATQTLKRGLMQTLFSRGVGTQDADGRWAPHTEFKDSELGEIPAGWEVAPLGALIEKLMDFRGRTPKKLGMDWGNGDIPALSANNVRMGYIDFDRECYLGSEELYRAWMVQGETKRNDLVFTMEAPLGNVAVVPDDRKYILSQRVILLRPNQNIDYRFLFQYLRSDSFAAILDVNSTGTTAKGIQQKRLVQLPVFVPPVSEQIHIAGVLGDVDAKLNVMNSRQSQYQLLKRGLMQKLLSGEWQVKLDSEALAA